MNPAPRSFRGVTGPVPPSLDTGQPCRNVEPPRKQIGLFSGRSYTPDFLVISLREQSRQNSPLTWLVDVSIELLELEISQLLDEPAWSNVHIGGSDHGPGGSNPGVTSRKRPCGALYMPISPFPASPPPGQGERVGGAEPASPSGSEGPPPTGAVSAARRSGTAGAVGGGCLDPAYYAGYHAGSPEIGRFRVSQYRGNYPLPAGFGPFTATLRPFSGGDLNGRR